MSLVIPHTFVGGPGNKAKASEVNANFQAVAAKFTTGAGGISAADIAIGAGIKGSGASNQISTTPGERVGTTTLEDDAVDSRVLKDDATFGAPNAAVNTAAHIKDGIITAAKIIDIPDAIVSALKLKKVERTQAFSQAVGTGFNSVVITPSPALPAVTAMMVLSITVEGIGPTATNCVASISVVNGVVSYCLIIGSVGSVTVNGTIRFRYLELT